MIDNIYDQAIIGADTFVPISQSLSLIWLEFVGMEFHFFIHNGWEFCLAAQVMIIFHFLIWAHLAAQFNRWDGRR